MPWRFEKIAAMEVACPSSDLGAYILFMPPKSCWERLPASLLFSIESPYYLNKKIYSHFSVQVCLA